MASNVEAQAFWRTVIGRYTGNRFEESSRHDQRWAGVVQRFESIGHDGRESLGDNAAR